MATVGLPRCPRIKGSIRSLTLRKIDSRLSCFLGFRPFSAAFHYRNRELAFSLLRNAVRFQRCSMAFVARRTYCTPTPPTLQTTFGKDTCKL